MEAPLRESEAAELAHVFAALADPVRLRLLSLIAAAGEVCSCELLAPLGRSQPTVSHHTKILADAGLIAGEKRGRWVWWSIVPTRVADVRRCPRFSRIGAGLDRSAEFQRVLHLDAVDEVDAGAE